MNKGVHEAHCCRYHGCKYGWQMALEEKLCPVTSGEIIQRYPCEQCDWAKQEWNDAWGVINRGKQWFGD